MPEIIMTGPDTFVVRGSPAASQYEQGREDVQRAVYALPADVTVVRTDNPPPKATSVGRPDITMSPVWPQKIETARKYNLTPETRSDMYRTPMYYDTYYPADDETKWVGKFQDAPYPFRYLASLAQFGLDN